MADKRQLKHDLWQLRHVKTWQLFILLILAGFIAATFLRLNNIGMVQRRDAVAQADQAGNQSDIRMRLYDLQRYVSGHMNANMGVIYLVNQYKRDSQVAINAAASADNPNGNIFKKAQEVCAPKYAGLGHYSQAFQQCVMGQLNSYAPSSDSSNSAALPKAELYRYSFISPLWSPDFAGFSVLLCVVIILAIVVRIGAYLILKLFLKIKHRGI